MHTLSLSDVGDHEHCLCDRYLIEDRISGEEEESETKRNEMKTRKIGSSLIGEDRAQVDAWNATGFRLVVASKCLSAAA